MHEQKPDEIKAPETPEEYFDYWDEIEQRYRYGCPRCGSDEIVWEEEECSRYCESCHSYV